MRESARTAMSSLSANAGPGRSRSVLPSGHGRAASRAGGELGAAGRKLGWGRHGGRLGNGIDRPAVCGDLAMTGEIMSPAELAARLGRELCASAVDRQRVDGLRYAAALDRSAVARAPLAVGGLFVRAPEDGRRALRPRVAEHAELLRTGRFGRTGRDPAPHCRSRQRVRSRGGSDRARRGPGRCRCDIGDTAALRGRLATGCGRGADRATNQETSGWERFARTSSSRTPWTEASSTVGTPRNVPSRSDGRQGGSTPEP